VVTPRVAEPASTRDDTADIVCESTRRADARVLGREGAAELDERGQREQGVDAQRDLGLEAARMPAASWRSASTSRTRAAGGDHTPRPASVSVGTRVDRSHRREAELRLEVRHRLADGRLHARSRRAAAEKLPASTTRSSDAELVERVRVVGEAVGRGGHVHAYHGS
jgi:hypothetical protein